LNLAENQLKILEDVLPLSLTNLNLSTNYLTILPHYLGTLIHLKQLDVSENQIASFPLELFSLQKMTKMYFGCNELKELPSGLSKSWKSLVTIDLSFNLLKECPNDLLSTNGLAINLRGNHKSCLKENPEGIASVNFQFEVPDEILPNLYLGDYECAKNKISLESLGITHILTVAKFRPLYLSRFTYKILEVDDANSEDILGHLESCVEFIDEGRKKGGILIHCRHGVSRSATVTIGYVMAKEKMDVKSAFELVKRKRSRIGPNSGFMSQLEQWEKMLS